MRKKRTTKDKLNKAGRRSGGNKPVVPLDVRQRFARALQTAMDNAGMGNSDLARAVWGERVGPSGHREARNRDRIGVYLRAEGYPSDETMVKIREVLPAFKDGGHDPAVPSDMPLSGAPFSMVAIDSRTVRLRIDATLPLQVATQIIALVQKAIDR